MKFNDAFPSRYLRGSDLEDGEKIFAEISHVERRIIGRNKDDKPVLIFRNGVSPIVLNAGTWRTIAKAFGDDSRERAGQSVELYAIDLEVEGKQVRGIRANPLEPHLSSSDRAAAVKAATEAEAKAAEAIKVATRKPALAGAKRGDLDDEIPF